MEIADRFAVNAPPAEAWSFFWDISRVAECLPGCESIAKLSDTAYQLRMAQRVGPFKVSMDVRMTVAEVEEGRRIVLSGEGQDRAGNRLQIKRLSTEIAETPSGGTQVDYLMDFNLYGKLAALGGSAVKRKIEETRAEFSRRLMNALGG